MIKTNNYELLELQREKRDIQVVESLLKNNYRTFQIRGEIWKSKFMQLVGNQTYST